MCISGCSEYIDGSPPAGTWVCATRILFTMVDVLEDNHMSAAEKGTRTGGGCVPEQEKHVECAEPVHDAAY